MRPSLKSRLPLVAVFSFACASAPVTPSSTPAQPGASTQSATGQKAAAPAKILPSARLKNTAGEYNSVVTGGLVGDVIKGDELALSDGTEVRLIGVKAPIAAFSQRVGDFYGKGALELTKNLAEWKQVRFEVDKQTHDRRGRLLAYVYTANGKFLQEELLRNGLAFAEAFPPNVKYRTQFLAWQREAMLAKKGMWGLDLSKYPRTNVIDKYVIEGVRARRVVNGDSIELDDGMIVRYIGVDAPDSENRSVPGEVGHAAYMANKKLIEGKELTIEYDIEPKDPKGRELAYIFVDNQLINATIVKDGHAIVAVFPPNVKYLEALIKAQEDASKGQRGLWGGKEQ